MATVLTAAELTDALRELPAWTGDNAGIERVIQAQSFLAGIRLVVRVAEAAEAADHHPDIDIRWRTVTFRLVTHSVEGVTEGDVAMARTIDAIVDSGPGARSGTGLG